MVRQTSIAQTLDMVADRARYDACAKKLLTYEAIIAWILKSCVREFSLFSIKYIMENCIAERPVVSDITVHQDELNASELADGNRRIVGLNTEANAISEQAVYYDIRLKAMVPGTPEPVQLIINLEIQSNDNPGYALVTRGLYYCARMISEQYGTVFTKEEYNKIQKVYSIWICPDPVKKHRNGMFRYQMHEETVLTTPYTRPEQYDLMEVVILNLGDAEETSRQEILDLLNLLFSATVSPAEKKRRLSSEYHIAMTEEFESEVTEMCNLSGALVRMGEQQGFERGIERGIERGEIKKARETAFNLKELGLSDEVIAKAVNVSVALVKQWLGADTVQ